MNYPYIFFEIRLDAVGRVKSYASGKKTLWWSFSGSRKRNVKWEIRADVADETNWQMKNESRLLVN